MPKLPMEKKTTADPVVAAGFDGAAAGIFAVRAITTIVGVATVLTVVAATSFAILSA